MFTVEVYESVLGDVVIQTFLRLRDRPEFSYHDGRGSLQTIPTYFDPVSVCIKGIRRLVSPSKIIETLVKKGQL